jgi:hypothetical protein
LQHCDVKVFAAESDDSFALTPILCHSLVLCSVAPNFEKILKDPDLDRDAEDQICVYLPEMVFSP